MNDGDDNVDDVFDDSSDEKITFERRSLILWRQKHLTFWWWWWRPDDNYDDADTNGANDFDLNIDHDDNLDIYRNNDDIHDDNKNDVLDMFAKTINQFLTNLMKYLRIHSRQSQQICSKHLKRCWNKIKNATTPRNSHC